MTFLSPPSPGSSHFILSMGRKSCILTPIINAMTCYLESRALVSLPAPSWGGYDGVRYALEYNYRAFRRKFFKRRGSPH
jgi:hypothetical protein